MLIALLKILLGFVLLVGGADLLVRGASSLALRLGISALVVGLTVVAFGTSSPELFVGVQAALSERGAIALGTIVGSNICNILLILGLASMLRPIRTHGQVLKFDLPVMIIVSLLFTAMLLLSGALTRVHGLVLFAGIVAYTAYTVHKARREGRELAPRVDPEQIPAGLRPRWMITFLIVGPVLLVIGSDLILDGSVVLAEGIGVSQAVIGLTVVAVGGSLPELATSVTAAVTGKGDIAAGNIIGSNLFNILCILGVAALAKPIPLQGVETVSLVDLAVMNLAAIVLLPMMRSEMQISRLEGAVMLTAYTGYVVYLFMG